MRNDKKKSWLTYFVLLCFRSHITSFIENRSGFVFFICGVSALLCLSKAHVSWSISSCRSKRQRKEKPWEKHVCVLPSQQLLTGHAYESLWNELDLGSNGSVYNGVFVYVCFPSELVEAVHSFSSHIIMIVWFLWKVVAGPVRVAVRSQWTTSKTPTKTR